MVGSRVKIIVGDVGGTNVRLATASVTDVGVELVSVWKQPGSRFPTFADALSTFLASETGAGGDRGGESPRRGAMEGEQTGGIAVGLAGVVRDGRVELLHRNWTVDAADLSAQLGTDRIVLVNDFMAMARAAPELSGEDVDDLAPGVADPDGAVVVGGPGTGFGLGVLKRHAPGDGPRGWIVLGGEGGHQLFTPQNELEWRVTQALRNEGVYVSNEVIASGSGFAQTLTALGAVMDLTVESLDPAVAVERARAGDRLSLEMCRLRARCTMAALGDAVLSANATGGVYVAGGVSAYISEWLVEPEALARFRDRGPRTSLLSSVPIRLITGDRAALIGAAHLWKDQQARGWL